MAEIQEGTVVDGRYRVISRIGSGGMADVWLADDTHLQRRVALKVLHSRFAQDREFVERFRREAEAAARLQHSNVVSVFDRGDIGGTFYIAMEFLDGRPLSELIDAGLTVDQAIAIVRQILEAARFAHRNGVIHRDFKPANVIVNAEGKATVTDFGIARAGVSEITQTGSVMGTAHYLSPEQAQGFDVIAASDLYSIGVILYECLTGRVPFEGESAVTVALKQVSQMPQRPSSLNPEVSPALDAVVMRALEKDPARRFQDADAFLAALNAAQRYPTAASPAGTTEFAPPPPVVAPVPVPVDEEEEARKKRRRWIWIAVAIAVLIGALVGYGLTRSTTTRVPNVTNQSLQDAKVDLRAEGFDYGKISYVRRSVPKNTVLEQDPPGDDSVEMDCSLLNFFCSKPAVDLTVSNGPGSAQIPSVSGLTLPDAQARLKDAGFQVAQVKKVFSTQFSDGSVLKSDPRGGTTQPRGTEVTLTVSKGPKLSVVPAVVGVDRAVAEQRIRARNLTPSVTLANSSKPSGQVISQAPDAGQQLDPGGTVSIVVSKGVEKVVVPSVISFLRSTAVTEIRNAGLNPVVEFQDTDLESENNRVLDQTPALGSKVPKGSSVTITVGRFVPPVGPTGPTGTTGPTTP
jgi:beta-lactam-binding protein with PASTA domain/predicted Ser/Thr protein kinase